MDVFHLLSCRLIILILQHVSQSNACKSLGSSQGLRSELLYVWSDNRADANSARQTCSSLGGRLAQFRDNSQKSTIINLMQQKYNQGLTTVDVFVNPREARATKFRGPGSGDQENIGTWSRPPRGDLRSFKLFRRATEDFSTRATFCFMTGRDAYRSVCNQGWISNFDVFGGTPETENTITLRHVFADNPGSSRLLLPGQPIPDGFREPSRTARDFPTLSIPDNSVFIGAKSDVGETSWLWSDGTMVTDSDYPTSDASVCQQMSWPLTYDNEINLFPKQCDQDRAYFACEFNFTPSFSPVQCNGSLLRLSWRRITFVGLLDDEPDLNVKVNVLESNMSSIVVPYNISELTINGLLQRMNYSVEVSLFRGNLQDQQSVVTILTSQTSYELPDPVTSAIAQNAPSDPTTCIVSWKYDPLYLHIASYKIFTNSTKHSSTVIVDVQDATNIAAIATDGQMLNYTVDLSQHGYNNTVLFQIQAVSCQKSSEIRDVQGFCTSFAQTSPNLPSSNAGMYAGIGVAAVLLIVIIAVVVYKRQSKKPVKQPTSDSTHISTDNPNQPAGLVDQPGYEYCKGHTTHDYAEIKPLEHEYLNPIPAQNVSTSTARDYANVSSAYEN